MVRCLVPDARAEGELVILPSGEAQHVTRVLRLRPGDGLVIFDGRGHEFDAIIEESSKSSVTVRVGRPRQPATEARIAVTLGQSVLKGDKMDDVVRDAVMMGVAAIQPLVSTRSEVTLDVLRRSDRRHRWERVAISSAKQCGRASVPPVLEPCEFEAWTAFQPRLGAPKLSGGGCLMLVEPSAAGDAIRLADMGREPPREVTLLIGPEGGWTSAEIERGIAAGQLITLGARTLRSDAMAIVAMAALFAIWREF